MIKKISISYFLSHELSALASQFDSATPESFRADLAPRLNKMVQAKDQLTLAINQTRASEYTPLLAAADQRRDDAYRAVKFAILSATFRKDETLKSHGNSLEAILKRHNMALYNLNYIAQTTEMDSLTLDLDKESDKIAALNMTGAYEEMKEAMEAFNTLYSARQQEYAENDIPLVGDSKKELSKQIIQLLRQVGIYYDDDAETIMPLIEVYNEIITEATARAKARQTRTRNNAQDEDTVDNTFVGESTT